MTKERYFEMARSVAAGHERIRELWQEYSSYLSDQNYERADVCAVEMNKLNISIAILAEYLADYILQNCEAQPVRTTEEGVK